MTCVCEHLSAAITSEETFLFHSAMSHCCVCSHINLCYILLLDDCNALTGGQAQWVPGEENGIVFVGYENQPRKLGFLFCFNKRCDS